MLEHTKRQVHEFCFPKCVLLSCLSPQFVCYFLVRDFPQSELDSEVNAPFLLNEHGDPHFLLHNFSENNILNN